VIAFRIAGRRHPILDGTGAAEYGGRWNSPGRPVIYAAGSLSLAMLEQLAHAAIGRFPLGHRFIEITIPDDVPVERVDPRAVSGWDADDQIASRAFGDRWLAEQRTCVLLTPSVIVPSERNVVTNPAHTDFSRLVASSPRDLNWDDRLRAFIRRE
jgi:RES domain-containing protein